MTAFNVVRFLVKPGREQEFLNAHRNVQTDWRRIDDLLSAKAEELSLFRPAGRQPRRQTHQCPGGELRRFSAIDDGRGDVGRQPGRRRRE